MRHTILTAVLGLSLTLLAGCASDEDKMMKGDKMIEEGRMMREKGVQMNDPAMTKKGQTKIDKGMEMKDDAMMDRKKR